MQRKSVHCTFWKVCSIYVMNCGSCSVYAIELNISGIPERFVSTLAPPAAGVLSAVGEACGEGETVMQKQALIIWIIVSVYLSHK